jgi:hypothetical protein
LESGTLFNPIKIILNKKCKIYQNSKKSNIFIRTTKLILIHNNRPKYFQSLKFLETRDKVQGILENMKILSIQIEIWI